ncbi:carcinoembryonic antigen-related cell adhesion molecule 1 isoform X1 [Xenopus laevis]|uniref:Carcinoembryonic antigen-related cell adhesion molecule 1 isoform X1 n=1 Tax=Xenopus laevis TaxID=8355 RepID=A0A8J1L7G1_XENLA|nr:carcinoembryonic antigen-related cell adhesion molecule 1 isoform X1 [Xenopus laevis]
MPCIDTALMGSYWYLSAPILLLFSLLGSISCLQNVSGNQGGTVTLTVKLNLPAQNQWVVTWRFGVSPIASAAVGNPPTYNNSCTDRCRLYGNANLQLDNLTPADTGEYTVIVTNINAGQQQTEQFHLTVYSAVTSAENVAGTEGKSVYLTVKLDLPAMRQVQWRVNSSTLIVIGSTGGSPAYTDNYRGRCHLYDNTTLRLDNLTHADTGEYSLSVSNLDSGATVTGSVYLTVYSPLSYPTLNVNNTYPVNDTSVTLHCDAGGQNVVNYTFYKDGVTACSQPHVTCNKDFLYFQPITMSDTGRYTCKIENPISSNTSQPLSIIVIGRVSGVTLSSNASSGLLCPGKDSVTLTCSALGTNVTFSWYLDGAPLPQDSRYHLMNSNSSLIISPVERTDSGSFICIGSNSLNSETSNLLTLRLGCTPDGNVQCNAVRLGQMVTLSCSWPGGNPAANVTMIFQNTRYTEQDTVTMDVPLNDISSGAELTCLGTQEGHFSFSTMILGTPMGATSNSVSLVKKGENVTMSVNLNWNRNVSPRIQILPATFSWFHRSSDRPLSVSGGKISVISSDYKSELVISSVTDSDNGIYECIAENFIGKSTFLFELSVTAGSNQLSPGAIAGIVIGVLFIVALIPLTIFFILRKKNNKKTPTPTNPVYENTGPQAPNTYDRVILGSKENMAESKPQESGYQELQFPHNNVYNHLRKTPR